MGELRARRIRVKGFYTRAELEQIANQIIGARLPGQADQLITEISTTQRFELGTPKDIGLSRYRYGQAGAVNIPLGVLCQAPVPGANHHDLVPAASYPVGTKKVTLTLGATPLAANEMAGGWMHVNDGTGQGQVFRILSHPAALAGASCEFTLIDPITTAFNAADTLCALTPNPYKAAIIHPSPPTAQLVGVPVVAITANYYGWFKTRGPAAVLTQGTLYIYHSVVPSATVDGAVMAASHSHTALNLVAADGVRDIAAGDDMQKLRDGAGNAIDTAEVSTGGAVTGAKDAVIPTSTDIVHSDEIGKVMRVEVDTDYSLIWLTLE